MASATRFNSFAFHRWRGIEKSGEWNAQETCPACPARRPGAGGCAACERVGVNKAAAGPDYYDGYYDGYYGPFVDGYWGDDGAFWYQDGGHAWHRDEGAHFRHDAGGAGFNHVHGTGVHRDH